MALAQALLQSELSHLEAVVEREVCGSQGRLVYCMNNSSSVILGLSKCLGVLPLLGAKSTLRRNPGTGTLLWNAPPTIAFCLCVFVCWFGDGIVSLLGRVWVSAGLSLPFLHSLLLSCFLWLPWD